MDERVHELIELLTDALTQQFQNIFAEPDYVEDERGDIYSPSHRKALQYNELAQQYYRALKALHPNAYAIHGVIVRHVWFGERPLTEDDIMMVPDRAEVSTSSATVWTETKSSGID